MAVGTSNISCTLTQARRVAARPVHRIALGVQPNILLFHSDGGISSRELRYRVREGIGHPHSETMKKWGRIALFSDRNGSCGDVDLASSTDVGIRQNSIIAFACFYCRPLSPNAFRAPAGARALALFGSLIGIFPCWRDRRCRTNPHPSVLGPICCYR